ncbi:transposase [Pseudomonas brassicacearum]|uniref:transposase n=1 Tax=Pseudomonas brassicacearum TaxID=930166 RepID=UPI000F4968E1|nr:transposase [Pseudomonas brassicacearum]
MQPKRRSYSKSFKIQVIQECALPGASIASVALSHSINANIVHKGFGCNRKQMLPSRQPSFR